MNVLVIIDNIIQYDRIKDLIREKNQKDISFTFRHSAVKSAIWDHPDFADGNSVMDVKANTENIIEGYQLVISVHCFQFFPAALVNAMRCINVHPGYNPINRGWYPQVFAIVNNLPIGATIHEMDEQLDHGAIIAQRIVSLYNWDTSLSVYNRVLEIEMELLAENFEAILLGNYVKIKPENEGYLFSKKDFKNLCKIDLTQQGSFSDFYNLLRALSHGDYKNAWFTDAESGKKVYLRLDVDHE